MSSEKKHKRNKPITFAGLTSRIAMSVVAGLLVVSYLSIFVNPAKAWFLVIFGLLFVPLALFNLFLLIWALKRRSKTFVIPLLALLPSLFFAGRYIQISNEQDITEMGNGSFKIVSYNVGRFYETGHETSKVSSCRDSIVAFVKGESPDIICFQEFRAQDLNSVKPYLASQFKDYKPVWYLYKTAGGCYGNVTLSRLPVRDKGKLIFENSRNLAIYTDVVAGDSILRIYNCHFESYAISLSRIARSLGKDSNVIKETETKMKKSINRRPKQVDQVLKHISDSPVAALVCGDFNDTPMSYTYYRMKKGRKDSFVEAGKGFGASFSRLWPLLRIDYILYPKGYMAISHEIVKIPYSDHYPIISEININD